MKLKLAALLTMVLMVCVFSKGHTFDGLNPTPSLISVGGGVFNITRKTQKAGMLQLEYKGSPFFGKKLFKVRPLLASMVTFQGGFWIGGGVNFEVYLGCPVVLTLGFAPGFYARGHGKDLGYIYEMRSSVELAYRFKNNSRFGAQFYHLSNGSFSSKNPGTEVLVAFYSFPLKWMFKEKG